MGGRNKKLPVFDAGVCRCCGSVAKCRVLNIEYYWLGRKEMYSDICAKTFGFSFSHLKGKEIDRLICATCVVRLRDANAFRKQVLSCEKRLLQSWNEKETKGETVIQVEIEMEEIREVSEVSANVEDVLGEGSNLGDNTILICDDSDSSPPSDEVVTEEPSNESVTDLQPAEGDQHSDMTEKLLENTDPDDTPAPVDVATNDCSKVSTEDYSEHTDLQPMEDDTDDELKMLQQKEVIQQAYENTTTVVRYSYVCPFNFSFSKFFCHYCKMSFEDPVELREHTETHDPAAFKDHDKPSQVDVTKIDCRLCAESINDVEEFKIHVSEVHGIPIHPIRGEFMKFRLSDSCSCMECGATFDLFHSLIRHMVDHFGASTCDICGAHFYEDSTLCAHKKLHESPPNSKPKRFPCPTCDRVFKTKRNLFVHEAGVHRMEPIHRCLKCDKRFVSRLLKYRHTIEAHAHGEGKVYSCDHCKKIYANRQALEQHDCRVLKRKPRALLYPCTLCEKKFYAAQRLNEHMTKHTGQKNHQCHLCGKWYSRPSTLKIHKLTHTDEKKFSCTLCTSTFALKSYLRNHMRRYHKKLVKVMSESFLENAVQT